MEETEPRPPSSIKPTPATPSLTTTTRGSYAATPSSSSGGGGSNSAGLLGSDASSCTPLKASKPSTPQPTAPSTPPLKPSSTTTTTTVANASPITAQAQQQQSLLATPVQPSPSKSTMADELELVYSQIVNLDGQLHQKDELITQLTAQNNALKQQLKSSLLTNQFRSRSTTSEGGDDLDSLNGGEGEERNEKYDEWSAAVKVLREHTSQLIKMSIPGAPAPAAGGSLGDEMYKLMVELEERLEQSGELVKNLQLQLKDEKEQARRKEKEWTADRAQILAEFEAGLASRTDPAVIESKLAEVQKQLNDTMEQNKMHVEIERQKTKALEELTEQLNQRTETAMEVQSLRTELTQRDEQLARASEANQKMILLIDAKEAGLHEALKQLEEARKQGVPMGAWREEREKLKSDLKKSQAAREVLERTVTKQREYIDKANSRLGVLAKASPSSLRRPGSTPSSSKGTPGMVSSPLPVSHLNFEEDEDEEVADEEEKKEEKKEDMVPGRLYEIQEENVRKLQTEVTRLEKDLVSKDDVIETMQRKLHIYEHAQEVEAKKQAHDRRVVEQGSVLQKEAQQLTLKQRKNMDAGQQREARALFLSQKLMSGSTSPKHQRVPR